MRPCGQRAGAANRQNAANFGQLSAKMAQIPKKLVEIKVFSLTFPAAKPHGIERRGSEEPA